MTKRSSFVIPPDLTDVAAIVDMLDRSPQLLMQKLASMCRSSPDGCMGLQTQGNIAVKTLPIRLLALCTVAHGKLGSSWSVDHRTYVAPHNLRRLTALPVRR
jgi:hypothetical protein